MRVYLFATIVEDKENEFETAFEEVRRRVAGVEGHRGDELLREQNKPGQYLLISEWESREAFLTWQKAPVHLEMTAPMQPYFAKPSDIGFYDVVGAFESH